MRVAVTGTPGTGKTTAVRRASLPTLEVVHLNDLVREDPALTTGRDEARDSLVADIEAVRDRLADREALLVEGHLAHHLPADRVVVLRCAPDRLRERLTERGVGEAEAAENAESEALDLVLSEAVAEHGRDAVYEVDTTEQSPEAVAAAIEAVVAGERAPAAGTVDFTAHL